MKKTKIYNWESLPITLPLQTVAIILNVSDVTVKHMIYDGRLNANKIGNKWLFDKEYIKNYVCEGCI